MRITVAACERRHKVASQGPDRVGSHHVYYDSVAMRLRGGLYWAAYLAVTLIVCHPVAPFGSGGA
jgi:hypothetical protein